MIDPVPDSPAPGNAQPSRFHLATTGTGRYCRPGCVEQPRTPDTVMVFTTAGAADAAGFHPCARCRPDPADPAPPSNDRVSRAIELIGAGVVDDFGVHGLAQRLGVSKAQLRSEIVTEVGAGPLDLAHTRRAQTARLLLEATDLRIADVAFAAGYANERECRDGLRRAFGRAPLDLRRESTPAHPTGRRELALRLGHRQPYASAPLLSFLGTRAITGIEEYDDGTYRRTMHLPRSYGVLDARPHPGYLRVHLQLGDLADLAAALQRTRRLFDLDADPAAISAVLGTDPLLAPLLRRWPGLRVPGQVDGFELGVRAVLGQQITVKGARTLAGRIVSKLGTGLSEAAGTLTHMFPTAAAVADDDLSDIGLTGARITSLRSLAAAVADQRLMLEPHADRDHTVQTLLRLPGIGPWTASYIAMRALGDRDAIPLTDLGIRHAVRALGAPTDRKEIATRAERWRPWRAYAALHLWATLTDPAQPAQPVSGG